MTDRELSSPHLFQFLTQEEWKLAFSIAFISSTDIYAGAYILSRYATPGLEGPSSDWLELFRRAIRYLSLEIGYVFAALEVHRDGRILAEAPICAPNELYVHLLSSGQLPDLASAFRTAIAVIDEHALGIDPTPIKDALAQVESDTNDALRRANPDAVRAIEKLRDRALAEIGVTRIRGSEALN